MRRSKIWEINTSCSIDIPNPGFSQANNVSQFNMSRWNLKSLTATYSAFNLACLSFSEINVIRQDGKTKDIKTGEVLKLSCKTFEKEAKLKWFKRNGVKLIALPKSMISSGDSNSVIFKIQGTVSAHSGTYVCEKTLRTRRVSAQVNITVKVKGKES